MIPNTNLFIVTSALKPAIGAFTDDDRFAQTIASLKSIRQKVPNVMIIFSDVSVRPISDLERETITGMVNLYIDMSGEPNVKRCSENGMKSHAENLLLFNTLSAMKYEPRITKMLSGVKRIFKFSARSELEDSFDITEYDNLFGKFIFKKRIPTWMTPIKDDATDLLITRMFSFCPSLIDTYLGVIHKNLADCDTGLDTEHAHFKNIPKEYLTEFDTIKCWGWLAGNGEIEHY